MLQIQGQQYGEWLVVREVAPRPSANNRKLRLFECVCSCGVRRNVQLSNLRSGASDNCGCASGRHFGYGTRIYSIWRGMVQRCTVPSYAQFKNYGSRGIGVCDEWRSFVAFREWALAPDGGYEKTLTLERKDNAGDYAPGNCVWATPKQQAQNKRSNVLVMHLGKTYVATALAAQLGVKYTTLLYRHRNGKQLENAT